MTQKISSENYWATHSISVAAVRKRSGFYRRTQYTSLYLTIVCRRPSGRT